MDEMQRRLRLGAAETTDEDRGHLAGGLEGGKVRQGLRVSGNGRPKRR